MEAPLSIFVKREFEKVETMNYQGRDFRIFYYRYNGYQIWGLTARILTDFAKKVLKA